MDHERQTAVHEAGHAVIGRALGVTCHDVSIVPDRPSEDLGYSVMDDPRFSWERGDGPKRPLAEAFCIALYAGAEAERLILGTSDVGDGVDCERATDCLTWAGVRGATFVGDDAYDSREAALRARARLEVMRRRAVIERVADALLIHGTLTGEQVDALLR